jgi:hypothetical protein
MAVVGQNQSFSLPKLVDKPKIPIVRHLIKDENNEEAEVIYIKIFFLLDLKNS